MSRDGQKETVTIWRCRQSTRLEAHAEAARAAPARSTDGPAALFVGFCDHGAPEEVCTCPTALVAWKRLCGLRSRWPDGDPRRARIVVGDARRGRPWLGDLS